MIVFIILSIIYLASILGIIYLSYRYIEYINRMEKEGCKCSEDVKRDMVKNFSYLIIALWIIMIIGIVVTPPKIFLGIMKNPIFSFINFVVVAGYGWLLFSYSGKLIDESCKCSESWLREAMQYQSYIYISLSVASFFMFLIKLLIGDDKREIFKLIRSVRNNLKN